MSRSFAIVPTCLALLFAACGGSDKPQTQAGATTSPGEAEAEAGAENLDANRCVPSTWDGAKDTRFEAPKTRLDPDKTYVATVDTNCGKFEITLDAERAPKTGGSFKFLADKHFYDGTLIHRVVPNFVLQGGDPQGDGKGGPGYSVVEKPPSDLVYDKGVVAMAKTASAKPGASGSQFFVVTGDDARELEPEYALLGRITGGEPVVQKIGAIITDPRTDLPDPPVVIRTIRVTETS